MYISYLQYSTIQYSTVVGWRAAGGGDSGFRPGMQYSALGQCIVCTGRPVGRRLSAAQRQAIILYRSAVISLLLAIILTTCEFIFQSCYPDKKTVTEYECIWNPPEGILQIQKWKKLCFSFLVPYYLYSPRLNKHFTIKKKRMFL